MPITEKIISLLIKNPKSQIELEINEAIFYIDNKSKCCGPFFYNYIAQLTDTLKKASSNEEKLSILEDAIL